MSDEIDITHGGIVAVDPVQLRAAAERVRAWGREADAAHAKLAAAARALTHAGCAIDGWGGSTWAWTTAGALVERIEGVARRLCGCADVYELVEVKAALAVAEARGEVEKVAALTREREAIAARNGGAEFAAFWLGVWAVLMPADEVSRQGLWGGALLGPGAGIVLGGLLAGVAWTASGTRAGQPVQGDRLRGVAPPVVVKRLAPAATVAAPGGLADAAARIPGGAQARVRVERYAMRDGSTEYAVYIAGTQSGGTGEVFDAGANPPLYFGEVTAPYEAVRSALADAGARPGDAVHALGHSQGGMLAGRLALEGEYDVRTLATFGSPIEAGVPETTLSVTVRHSDDIVAVLAGGGSGAGVGSPDSIVVERAADPIPWLHDLALPAHRMESYIDTAQLVDESSDPRVNEVRRTFRHLREDAASVDVIEYAAYEPARVSGASSGGAG